MGPARAIGHVIHRLPLYGTGNTPALSLPKLPFMCGCLPGRGHLRQKLDARTHPGGDVRPGKMQQLYETRLPAHWPGRGVRRMYPGMPYGKGLAGTQNRMIQDFLPSLRLTPSGPMT